MAFNRLPFAVASLIFIALTCLGIYGNVFTDHRRLPLPMSIKVLSILLPASQLIGGFWVFARAKVNITIVANAGYALSLLDATLISTAATYLSELPLSCVLDETWRRWFMHKNDKAIRAVQDKLYCCGLHSTKDKAWPFPDKTHGVDACLNAFGRDNPCFGSMMNASRKAATLFVAIGVVSLLLKISASVVWQVRFPAWARAGKSHHHHHQQQQHQQAREARLLTAQEEEVTTTGERYRDEEPATGAP